MDGELMVIHDPTLKRTADRRGKVVEYSAADLVKMDARKGGPGWVKPCPIPRLEELFETCDFDHWQLEVKSASRTRAATTVLAIREMAVRFGLMDKVTVTSSSREVLKAAVELTPDLSRGLVAEYAWLDPLKVAQNYGCEILALNWTLCTPERLEKAQRQGLHVSVWTVNEPALMRRLADFGATGRSRSKKPVEAVVGRYPIGFCHGRVVERGVDEVLEGIELTRLVHDRLADVHDLRRLVAEAMHAEDFQGFTVEQDLQHALRLTGDLRTRHALEECLAHFVRHFGLGQFVLVLADRADLGNGVDPGRHVVHVAPAAIVDDAASG
ncbi:unnamed protein product [Tuber aestivum]|uniref:GP-PDE domain-containing protein n=1 Tax=Tuber aestivum TaxID=59557 RepID=A0A292Q6X0_9PEZI|nr:unnamed protein product [Tuber aestivum]